MTASQKNVFKKKKLRVLGTGAYLPENVLNALEFDKQLNIPPGTSFETSGVQTRRWANFRGHESNTMMASHAATMALKKADLAPEKLDAIIYAAFSYDQPLPCSASLVQRQLGLKKSGISCFDVMSTCLSFVTALDLASSLIETDRHERILIVSSETPSAALNWKHLESCTLFSDGAAAMVVSKADASQSSHVFLTHHKTFSEGLDYCQIRGGGTNIMPAHYQKSDQPDANYLFEMDGKKAFKIARYELPKFVNEMAQGDVRFENCDWIVPHQASSSSLFLLQRQFQIPDSKFVNIIEDYGNMISASIPFAFHQLSESNKLKRGDRVLLIGTSAGFSIGAVGFEY
jgi:3-oxoacyl-[acyl-carrier-protein] synthase-3